MCELVACLRGHAGTPNRAAACLRSCRAPSGSAAAAAACALFLARSRFIARMVHGRWGRPAFEALRGPARLPAVPEPPTGGMFKCVVETAHRGSWPSAEDGWWAWARLLLLAAPQVQRETGLCPRRPSGAGPLLPRRCCCPAGKFPAAGGDVLYQRTRDRRTAFVFSYADGATLQANQKSPGVL